MIILSASKRTKKKLLRQIEFNIAQSAPIDTDEVNELRGNRIEKRSVHIYDDLYEIVGWAGIKRIICVNREVRIKVKTTPRLIKLFLYKA